VDPITWLIVALVNAAALWALKEDIEDIESENDGALINKASNLAQIPVIYGERKIGGTRVFVETSGTDNQYLYIALVLCEGEVEDIGSVYINDIDSQDAKFTGLVTINKHLGTDDQTADSTLLNAPSWTADHRLRGVAYLGIRLKWDREIFGSIPTFTSIVKGKKIRTFDINGSLSTGTQYSTNTAECLLDYLTNDRYGKGLQVTDFEQDYTSFYTASQLCESLVEAYDGGSYINRFDCNAIIKTDATVMSNVKVFLSGMRGLLPYTQGIYKLIIENKAITDTLTQQPIYEFAFTEDHIIDGISFTGEKKSNRFNRVIATFVNPDNNWQEDQIEYPDADSAEYTDFLAEDDGFDLEDRINLPTVTNVYQAKSMAKTILKKSRNGIKCSFISTAEALQLAVGDLVTITHSTPGWLNKPFRIIDLTLQPDGNVMAAFLEHQDDNYTWSTSDQAVIIPDTNLPDPYSVSAPTNLAVNSGQNYQITNDDGSTSPRVYLSWTASNDSFVDYYVAQIATTDGVWDIEHRTDSSPLYVSGVASGTVIDVRIKAVNAMGISSTWLLGENRTIDNLVGGGSGGVTTFSSNGAPETDLEAGDLWFDTDNNNILHRWDGREVYDIAGWVALQDGSIPTGALASLDQVGSGQINVSQISDINSNIGAIDSGSINIGNGKFAVASNGNVTIQNTTSGNRLEIKNNVIKVIDANNIVRVQIGEL